MQFGKITIICGLAVEAWMLVFVIAAAVQLLVVGLSA